MEDICYITLRCRDCENESCLLCPQGAYISENNLMGCTRQVTEEEKIIYNHYTNEVIPFLHLSKNKKSEIELYKEIISFLLSLYSKPIGTKLGKRGKAIK
jgi:hypothetical protein